MGGLEAVWVFAIGNSTCGGVGPQLACFQFVRFPQICQPYVWRNLTPNGLSAIWPHENQERDP